MRDIEDYTVFVFGGGGTKGIAHIGALSALVDVYPSHNPSPCATCCERLQDQNKECLLATSARTELPSRIKQQTSSLPQNAAYFQGIWLPQCLRHRPWLQYVTTYVGTSFGALVSLALALEYTPNALLDEVQTLKRTDFFTPSFSAIVSKFALDSGRNVRSFLRRFIQNSPLTKRLQRIAVSRAAMKHFIPWRGYLQFQRIVSTLRTGCVTFQDLTAITGRTLVFAAYQPECTSVDYLGTWTTPAVSIESAAFASMCLPLVYSPAYLHEPGVSPGAQQTTQKHYFDGGIEDNFPMAMFDEGEALGFYLAWNSITIPKAASHVAAATSHDDHEERKEAPGASTVSSDLSHKGFFQSMKGLVSHLAQNMTLSQLLRLPREYWDHILFLTIPSDVSTMTMFQENQLQTTIQPIVSAGYMSCASFLGRSRALQTRNINELYDELQFYHGRSLVLEHYVSQVLCIMAMVKYGMAE